jgi:hypothetical protein
MPRHFFEYLFIYFIFFLRQPHRRNSSCVNKVDQRIEDIVYNSCNITSLVKDMRLATVSWACHSFNSSLLFFFFLERYLLSDTDGLGFAVEDFRSFDFFPGTAFTASVTHIRRKRPVLVLPIGPAGVGKSWLARQLSERLPAGVYLMNKQARFLADKMSDRLSGRPPFFFPFFVRLFFFFFSFSFFLLDQGPGLFGTRGTRCLHRRTREPV